MLFFIQAGKNGNGWLNDRWEVELHHVLVTFSIFIAKDAEDDSIHFVTIFFNFKPLSYCEAKCFRVEFHERQRTSTQRRTSCQSCVSGHVQIITEYASRYATKCDRSNFIFIYQIQACLVTAGQLGSWEWQLLASNLIANMKG